MSDDRFDTVFMALWIGGMLSMVVHIGGYYADLWSYESPVWWIALACMVGITVLGIQSAVVGRLGSGVEPGPERPLRAVDGQITSGFDKWQRRETVRGESEVVRIEHVARMHHFDSGYRDTGQPRELTMDLTAGDARAVRDLLDDWLAEREGERDVKGEA